MASPRSYDDSPRRVVAATLVVAAVVAGFGIAYLLGDVLFLLFVGVVLATAVEPMIDALQRRRVPQAFAVCAVYACVILVLAAAAAVGAPYVSSQVGHWPARFRVRTNRPINGWPAPGTRFGRESPGESWRSPHRSGPRRNWSNRWRPSARRPRIWRWRPADYWWPAGSCCWPSTGRFRETAPSAGCCCCCRSPGATGRETRSPRSKGRSALTFAVKASSAWPWPAWPRSSMACWDFVMPSCWALSPGSWKCCRCSDPSWGPSRR